MTDQRSVWMFKCLRLTPRAEPSLIGDLHKVSADHSHFFMLYLWTFRPCYRGRSMRTLHRGYWRCRKLAGTTDYQHTSSFQMLSKFRVKTFHGKMSLWDKRSRFRWTNHYTNWHHPGETKDHKIFGKNKFCSFWKRIATLYRLSELLLKLHTTFHWEIKPFFFQLLKTTEIIHKIIITPEPMNDFCDFVDVLDKCCQLTLRQPLLDKQLNLMTDSSFKAAGNAVLSEDDPNQKLRQHANPMPQLHTVTKYLLPHK